MSVLDIVRTYMAFVVFLSYKLFYNGLKLYLLQQQSCKLKKKSIFIMVSEAVP